MGTVHGGILCDIADAAMGIAYASGLDEGETFTTLELKINFLKPVRTGRLTATGRIVKAGRTVGLVECDVTDEQGEPRRPRDEHVHDPARRAGGGPVGAVSATAGSIALPAAVGPARGGPHAPPPRGRGRAHPPPARRPQRARHGAPGRA